MQLNKEEKIDLKSFSKFLIKRSIILNLLIQILIILYFIWDHIDEFDISLGIYVVIMSLFLITIHIYGVYLNIKYYSNRVSYFSYKFTDDSIIVAFKGSKKITDAELSLKYSEIKFFINENSFWLSIFLPRGYVSIIFSKKNELLWVWERGMKNIVKMGRIMIDDATCGFSENNIFIPYISKSEAESIRIFLLSKGVECKK